MALARRFTSPAIFLAIVTLLAAITAAHWAEVTSSLKQHFEEWLAITLLTCVLMVVQTINFLRLLAHCEPLPLRRTVFAWALGGLANYAAPFQPGLAVRIAFLRSRGVALSRSISATARQIQLSLWTAIGLAALSLLFRADLPALLSAAVLAAIFLGWRTLLSWLERGLSEGILKRRLRPKTQLALQHALAPEPLHRIPIFVAQYVLSASAFFIAYGSFGAPLPAHQAILLAVATTVSALFAIAPNNLGIQEVILGAAALAHGLQTGEAVSIAVLFRATHISACIVLMAVAAGLSHLSADSQRWPPRR